MSTTITTRALPDVLQPLNDHFEVKVQHNAWQFRCLDCSLAWSLGKSHVKLDGVDFTSALLQHGEGHPHLVYVSWDLGRPWHIAYAAIPTRAVCGLAMPHPEWSPAGWPKTTDKPHLVHRACSDAQPVGGSFRKLVTA